MADNQKFVQSQTFFLAGSGAVSGATSVTLSSMYQIDGSTTLTMTNFGTLGYMTLEPNNGTQEEAITFSGITQNSNGTATLTGVKTVLFIDPYTQTSGLAKSHPGGAKAIISNTAAFYDRLASLDDDETVAGVWTFPDDPSRPRVPTDTDTTGATSFVTLGQLSRQAISGASNASTTVKGIVELATQAEVDARTTTGGTGALLVATPDVTRSTLLSDYIADTGTVTAYAIAPSPAITAYTIGQRFVFKASHASDAGAVTLNVNSLGAKPLRAGKANLRNETIRTNWIVAAVYDGTGFEIENVPAHVPLSQDGQEVYGVSSTGNTTWTVALVPAMSKYIAGMVVNFKPDTVGGQPTLNVNGLGAKNVKKYNAGVIDAVRGGDLVANQVASVIYDGTQFQLLNQLSSTPQYTNGTTSKDAGDASTTQNIAHGLGRKPKKVKITALSNAMAVVDGDHAVTVYNGTTQSSISIWGTSSNHGYGAQFSISAAATSTNSQDGVITWDTTNIIITWTKTNSPTGVFNLLWEAEA